VPQYYNATVTGAVTAAAWNGTSGGIVTLDVANTLTFSVGSINVSALGFRGVVDSSSPTFYEAPDVNPQGVAGE